ncbi:winged helix-turn-helix domain-containing protein [Nitratireductor luteus]|uniref:winged helix-turn-helix domain-containing protein n=1 Tax=Nitratireductor luteus TaxID=2976980 RepID=UPI00224085A8|nr:response regulator transcription factor [Nitratireductor luteus]
MKPIVVICSRDAELYLILEHILEVEGFDTRLANDADEAVPTAKERPAAVILDCQPNGLDALTLHSRLKQEGGARKIPVVALIAPGAENLHMALLRAGIDDGLVRPLVPARLVASLRSWIAQPRRTILPDGGNALVIGSLELHPESFRVRRNGKEIQLRATEFRIFRYLIENRERVFSREALIAAAWPNNVHVSARTVDVHISRLRKALRKIGCHDLIRTERSGGYRIDKGNGF